MESPRPPSASGATVQAPATVRPPPAPPAAVATPAKPHRIEPNALVAIGLLTLSWAWWAWEQGAYFGKVLLPGTILLCLGTILLLITAPWRGRIALSRPAALAVWALAALGVWTLCSALWSPAPDVALEDAQRVLTYALAFGLGIWLCNLLGRRMELALVPLAAAAALVGLATLITLLIGNDVGTYLEGDGTLQFPLGYRNANAAFFLIAAWPLFGLGTTQRFDWPIRGAAIGGSTLCLELGLLSQSRASLIAAAVAVAVYLLVVPGRVRGLAWMLLAAAPALIVVPLLSGLFEASPDVVLTRLRHAAGAAAAGALVSIVVASLAARLEPRLKISREREERANRLVPRAMAGLLALGLIAFVIAVGNPVSWIGDRVSEFNSGQTGTIGNASTRFSFNVASQRSDLWRVAADDALHDPLFGDGAGGYRYSYLQNRHSSTQNARDAHSVELETLAELGLPGLALMVLAIGGALLGAGRARRLGPSAAALSAIALAAAAYWLVHASLDWFWRYPAVTAPVLALLGCACAPAVMMPGRRDRGSGRRWLAVAVTLLAISAVPPAVSLLYLNNAYGEWHTDLGRAYSDLDRARAWNPLSLDPLLAEGVIARQAGQQQRAIDAFTRAADLRPEEWATHYYLAKMYAASAPRLAAGEIAAARALNPREPAITALAHQLRSAVGVRPARSGPG